MSFVNLAASLAGQPHKMQVSSAKLPSIRTHPLLPAHQPQKKQYAKIMRPGNWMAGGRTRVESPTSPPLSIKG